MSTRSSRDPFSAVLARSHSNSNVLCLGAEVIGSGIAVAVVEAWMTTGFLANEERYLRRAEQGRVIAERHLRPLDDARRGRRHSQRRTRRR